MRHLVIIPTYNECENVEAIIEAVLALDNTEVLIVDDNSPDGTSNIVEEIKASRSDHRIHLIKRKGKLGLGTAYVAGFKYALENDMDFISEMDADFSHNPNDLLRLREACINGADVAVGSRYVNGGGFENWPRHRIIISKGGSLYVQMLTRMPVKDATAGFVTYRNQVLRSIDLDKIQFTGYAFQIEMKYVSWKLGFKIVEVPIIFKERELGTSKMSGAIIKEAVLGVLKLLGRNIKTYYGSEYYHSF